MSRPKGSLNKPRNESSGLTYRNILLMLVIGVPVKKIAWALDVPPEVIEAVKVRIRAEHKLQNQVFMNGCFAELDNDQKGVAEHLLRSNFNSGDKECV